MRCALVLTAALSLSMVAHGRGIDVVPVSERLSVTNTGAAALVALKIGEAQIQRLNPGVSVEVAASPDVTLHGRFALSDWHQALDDLDVVWAPYHLRTAGFLLDALEPGEPGAPEAAANLNALRMTPVESLAAWPGTQALRQALVARAARFAPPELTVLLMSQLDPEQTTTVDWPPAYAGLESAVESLRIAIERHGSHPTILDGLRTHPAWALDRGLPHPGLLDFGVPIQSAGTTASPAEMQTLTQQLSSALETGRQDDATRLAVDAARKMPAEGSKDARLTRMSCGGLDLGAHRAIKHRKWLSAQAYLTLAGRVCGDRLTYRARVAEFFRGRGDEAIEALDLSQALDWFRAALWFASERQDRARLADTHAELAILNFRTGNPVRGAAHLSKANEHGPLRPRVVAASELKPTADPRARFGLIIIILFVAFFSIRRLFRLFGDRRNEPRLD